MNRKFILPYKMGSNSVNNLREYLGIKGIRLENSKYQSKPTDKIINWGNSDPPVNVENTEILNPPKVLKNVTNKLNFFKLLSDHTVNNKPRIPDWSQNKEEAKNWIADGCVVFARQKLTGHSGEGIVICTSAQNVDTEKTNTLFVKYVKKKSEYRVHFMNGKIFDIQRKAKRRDEETTENQWLIQNLENGFVYSRNNVGDVPQDVTTQVEKTIVCLKGLDFGAVDVIYNKWQNKAYVLEVNSSPGLEGTTLDNYVKGFKNEYGF